MCTDELLSRITVHRWLPLRPPSAPRPCGHPIFWVYIASNQAHSAAGRVGLGLGSHCPHDWEPFTQWATWPAVPDRSACPCVVQRASHWPTGPCSEENRGKREFAFPGCLTAREKTTQGDLLSGYR